MYFGILKRDLKRKKTMNTILLIFMILSVMFVSSSVNTMISVMSATDKFLDVSGAEDYFVATLGSKSGEKVLEKLKDLDCVSLIKSEKVFYLNENSIKYNGKTAQISATGVLNSVENLSIRIFDTNKNELTQINDGEIYVKNSFLETNNIAIGEKIRITSGGYTGEFKIKGTVLDVLFGSEMMGTPRFIISQNDYEKFEQSSNEEKYEMYKGVILNMAVNDLKKVENTDSSMEGIAFTGTRNVIKLSYIMDMITAGIFLIVSICLIIISLVLLKFTIGFTISEEYREIGVMKAIGIRNGKIQTLYMVKYIAMAIVSAVIGFFVGMPFGDMMKSQSSKHMVAGEENGIFINLICSVIVVMIIAFFCRMSTGKVKSFTPVDAIRNGESGKRYKKKGVLSLSKGHTRPIFFMAVNDILSGFRHYAVMTVTFIVGILMITIIINTMSTVQSPKLLAWFSMADCDVALEDKESAEKYTRPDGQKIKAEYLEKMEKTLADNQIPAECFGETIFKLSVQNGERKTMSLAFIGTGTTTDQYAYIDGTPPESVDEIAISYLTADKLNVKIGDTITVKTGGEKEEFMVTALYQSMNNMGEGVRLSEKLNIDFSKALGYFSYQIKFKDHPSDAEFNKRCEKIKELYPDYKLRTAGEYLDYSISGVAGAMSDTKDFIILIVMIINILVVVLMEKSFLTKERGEIALMKAIGFKNHTLIAWQTIRIALLMAAAVIIAIVLTEPLSQLAVRGIFRTMGAKYIVFDTNILEAYIIYPLAVFAVTLLATMISALGVRSISSREVNNIE